MKLTDDTNEWPESSDPVCWKVLPIEENVRYIATSNSIQPGILAGTPLFLEKKKKTDDEFVLFTMFRVGNKSCPHQRNDVRYFKTHADIYRALEGTNPVLDIRWARERIDEFQERIKDLEKTYFAEE